MPRFVSLCSTVIRPDSEWKDLLQTCVRQSLFASDVRRGIQNCSSCIKRNRTLFGQGRVLFNKTASAARELFAVRRSALDRCAQRLRLIRTGGLSRGEILRRPLLTANIPSARTRQEVQDILRIQREQNRLGGLRKKAITERAEKTELRRTLIEVERNGAELRRVVAHLVRSR